MLSLKLFLKEISIFFVFFCSFLFVFSLFRLAFCFFYISDLDIEKYFWLKGLYEGVRFDVSVFFMFFLPFFLVSRIRIFFSLKFINGMLSLFLYLYASLISIVSIADFSYYKYAGKRLSYEAFVYLDFSMIPIVKTFIIDNAYFFIFGLIFIGYFVYILKKICLLWFRVFQFCDECSMKNKIFFLSFSLLFVPIGILGWRGGWQRVPIRLTDSSVTPHIIVNNMILNSPFMISRTLNAYRLPVLMEASLAFANVHKVLGVEDAQKIDPYYPFYLRTKNESTPKIGLKPNIVLILWESLSAFHTAVNPNVDIEATPFLNEILKESLVFERFFATGFRTTSGLFSTLTGIPDTPGIPVMKRLELGSNFLSLSRLLKKQGYFNAFFHGGHLDFDSLKNMLIQEEFDSYVGQEELKPQKIKMSTWGFHDDILFSRVLNDLDKIKKPFFSFILTVTSHAPYILPKYAKELLPESDSNSQRKYLNSLYFTDSSLKEFFFKAKKQDFFDNTIFIITGDHTHHDSLDPYEDKHIPFIIYAPKLLKPQRLKMIGSQTDILPTIAGMLNLPYYASIGQNLFELKDDEGTAYFISGNSAGIIDHDFFAIKSVLSKDSHVMVYKKGSFSKTLDLHEIKDKYSLLIDSFAEATWSVLRENRVSPGNF